LLYFQYKQVSGPQVIACNFNAG